MGGFAERIGRHDHLVAVAYAVRGQRQQEAEGPARNRDRVGPAEIGRKGRLERFRHRTAGHARRPQDGIDRLQLRQRDIGVRERDERRVCVVGNIAATLDPILRNGEIVHGTEVRRANTMPVARVGSAVMCGQ